MITEPQMPRISVVMSVYNGAKYLDYALYSIVNQTYKNFEFIIIDDGSTDETWNILNRCGDVRLRLFRKNKNEGLVSGLNRGIAEARGEYIARMDADDIALPKRFETQVNFLDHNDKVVALGTRAIQINHEGRIINDIVNITDPKRVRLYLERGLNPMIHSSVMMRKKIVNEAGGYRDAFKHAEDYDLWLRMLELGDICNLRDRLMMYRSNILGIRLNNVIDAGYSHAYAYDCFQRRIRNEKEVNRERFVASCDRKRLEVCWLWSAVREMLLLSEVSKAIELLKEIVARDKNHIKARIILFTLRSPKMKWISKCYSSYGHLRGWLSNLPFASLLSMLKNIKVFLTNKR
jgi:glycosyltransferase involved in cell wall biosynthesis